MKPGNLIVGDDGTVTVMDLGIVKQIDDGAEATTSAATGTPRYMPPEMFSNGIVDGRADLYSLGIIAYRALAGVVPFDGPTPMAILYKQAHTAPAPLRSVSPSVSKDMAAVVHRLLEKDPEARYADAHALIETLVSISTNRERGSRFPLFIAAAALIAAGAWYGLNHIQETNDGPGGQQPSSPPAPLVTVIDQRAAGDTKNEKARQVPTDASVVPAMRPPADAAIEMVVLRIRSKPSGADVFEGGRRIGRTPLRLDRPKSNSRQNFRLKKRGYRVTAVQLSLKKSGAVSKTLEPLIELLPQ